MVSLHQMQSKCNLANRMQKAPMNFIFTKLKLAKLYS